MSNLDKSVGLLRFISESPVFKGSALIILAILALLFSFSMYKNGKKLDYPFLIFIFIAAFILFYGLFILAVRPEWWKPFV
jgi:hypothetical protein